MNTPMSDPQTIVDGATRLYGIIGDPIAQVGSPRMLTAAFRSARVNALCVPLHVLPGMFDETLRGLRALGNLDGIIVTVPYKMRALGMVDHLLPAAKLIRAVNVIRREPDGWHGDMLDGRGMVGGLERNGHSVAGKRVMLIGAGGAGSAVAFALAEAGAAAVTLFDVDQVKAADLAARVAAAYPACPVAAAAPQARGHDILINATPIGMAPGDGLPAPLGELDPSLIVFDVITKPEVTPLLQHARACGCPAYGGRHMLEAQAKAMLRFFGIPT